MTRLYYCRAWGWKRYWLTSWYCCGVWRRKEIWLLTCCYGTYKSSWLSDIIAVREDRNALDWFSNDVAVVENIGRLVWFLVGVVALEDVNETDWFPKEAEVLENENILGLLFDHVAVHWLLFPVVFEFVNIEGVELVEGKKQLGFLRDLAPMSENEKNTVWPRDDFAPLEREEQVDLLNENDFVLGNENQLSFSLFDDVSFEEENKFCWHPEFNMALEDEKQSSPILDGIVVLTCENGLVWLPDGVVRSDNETRLRWLVNDFGGLVGKSILGSSHNTTIVLENEDWLSGDLVLLNYIKPLGWQACTIVELKGEKNVGWLSNTVVVLENENNFDWLADDIVLLTGENKLSWLSNATAVREEKNVPH